MNKKVIMGTERLQRVAEFPKKSGFVFNARGLVLLGRVDTILAGLQTSGTKQVAGRHDRRGGTDRRATLAAELSAELTSLRETALALDPEQFPGIPAQFEAPIPRVYQALRDTAGAYLLHVTPAAIKAAFVEREYPATFVEDLTALIADFDEAHEAQNGGLIDMMNSTKSMDTVMHEAHGIVRELSAMVRKRLRKSDPAMYATWKQLARLHRLPQRSGDPEVPTGTTVAAPTASEAPAATDAAEPAPEVAPVAATAVAPATSADPVTTP